MGGRSGDAAGPGPRRAAQATVAMRRATHGTAGRNWALPRPRTLLLRGYIYHTPLACDLKVRAKLMRPAALRLFTTHPDLDRMHPALQTPRRAGTGVRPQPRGTTGRAQRHGARRRGNADRCPAEFPSRYLLTSAMQWPTLSAASHWQRRHCVASRMQHRRQSPFGTSVCGPVRICAARQHGRAWGAAVGRSAAHSAAAHPATPPPPPPPGPAGAMHHAPCAKQWLASCPNRGLQRQCTFFAGGFAAHADARWCVLSPHLLSRADREPFAQRPLATKSSRNPCGCQAASGSR